MNLATIEDIKKIQGSDKDARLLAFLATQLKHTANSGQPYRDIIDCFFRFLHPMLEAKMELNLILMNAENISLKIFNFQYLHIQSKG